MTTLADALNRITVPPTPPGGLKWTYAVPTCSGVRRRNGPGTAPAVEDALREVIVRHDYGYLTPLAARQMAVACAAWLADRSGWQVDPDWIRPLPDVIKGLEAAITLFSRPGSPVILPTPAYMPFLTLPPLLGRKIIQVPMITVNGRAALDLDGIGAAFRAGGHLLVLCNPCNPVGRVYTQAELAAWVRLSSATAAACSPTRSTRRWSTPGTGTSPTPRSARSPPGTPSPRPRPPRAGTCPASSALAHPGPRGGPRVLGRGRPVHRARREHAGRARQHRGVHRGPGLARGGAGLPRPGRRCWGTCSPSTCLGSATGPRKARTWPGWTAASWVWVTVPANSPWTRGRCWSTTAGVRCGGERPRPAQLRHSLADPRGGRRPDGTGRGQQLTRILTEQDRPP